MKLLISRFYGALYPNGSTASTIKALSVGDYPDDELMSLIAVAVDFDSLNDLMISYLNNEKQNILTINIFLYIGY